MAVRFHTSRVGRVVPETDDASSLVLDAPFEYRAGQFVTFRVEIDGEQHHRCYSMSSAPSVDDELTVTVKRVPGGLVSNWLLDNVHDGDDVEISEPAGVFCLPDGDRPLVAFAAGSGITPIQSIAKEALATTRRKVRLLYANRDEASTIFRDALDERVEVVHHLDVERGFVDAEAVRRFVGAGLDVEAFVCGPAPFMDVVESTLLGLGVDPARIHIERFTPGGPVVPADDGEAGPCEITIEIGRKKQTTDHRPGTTVLQTARELGMSPPFSCEAGNCATCMARCVQGSVKMLVNDALTPEEVEEGWILTCQSVPTSASVHVVYE